MTRRYGVIASLEGYQGEQLHIHKIKDNYVLMTVIKDGERKIKWYKLRFEILEGLNQKVETKKLPYIIYENDVYSIDDFHEWKRG